MQFEFSGQIFE